MPLKITTWNINSVRLRINLVAKFLKSARPDVLCLQETKCPDDAFPLKRFHRLGYEYSAINGQKGYHGVAVLSRLPIERFDVHSFCGKTDCRHISVVLGEKAGLKDPLEGVEARGLQFVSAGERQGLGQHAGPGQRGGPGRYVGSGHRSMHVSSLEGKMPKRQGKHTSKFRKRVYSYIYIEDIKILLAFPPGCRDEADGFPKLRAAMKGEPRL